MNSQLVLLTDATAIQTTICTVRSDLQHHPYHLAIMLLLAKDTANYYFQILRRYQSNYCYQQAVSLSS